MKRFRMLMLTTATVGLMLAGHVRAADDPGGPGGPAGGPPPNQDGGGPGGPGGAGQGRQRGPGGPGSGGPRIIPPFVEQQLNLTDDQRKQIAELEKEVKEKLAKILTPEQMKMLAAARPPRRGGGGQGGAGGGQRG